MSANHVRGEADAPLRLIEYGDFQCPFCADAFPIVEEVRRRLGDRLAFVFRHFPIAEKHPRAELAAEAAEAAGAQGRFWEMHDRLFAARRRLEPDELRHYAAEVGLDHQRFDADMASHRFLDRVREQHDEGERAGVQGTPTFFINGERYTGFYDEETLIDVLTTTGRST